jgi:hypothetical protein
MPPLTQKIKPAEQGQGNVIYSQWGLIPKNPSVGSLGAGGSFFLPMKIVPSYIEKKGKYGCFSLFFLALLRVLRVREPEVRCGYNSSYFLR